MLPGQAACFLAQLGEGRGMKIAQAQQHAVGAAQPQVRQVYRSQVALERHPTAEIVLRSGRLPGADELLSTFVRQQIELAQLQGGIWLQTRGADGEHLQGRRFKSIMPA